MNKHEIGSEHHRIMQGGGKSVPSAAELAREMGLEVKPPLRPFQTQQLRKALPGYVDQLVESAARLVAEPGGKLMNVTIEQLRAVVAERAALIAGEEIADELHRSLYQQRLQADDVGMGLLQKLDRRVTAIAEDDPAILERWKALRDFLGHYRPGSRRRKVPAPTTTTSVPAPVEVAQ